MRNLRNHKLDDGRMDTTDELDTIDTLVERARIAQRGL